MCLTQLDVGILDDRTFDARDRFSDLFATLLSTRTLPNLPTLDTVASEQLVDSNVSRLQVLAQTQYQQMLDLPRHEKYSRHVIGTDGTWIGFICRWEPHVCSSVHGHPSFAYYHVLKGDFSMDLFSTTYDEHAVHTKTTQMSEGDCIWQHGKPGCYDNFVHRVSTSNTGGLTLHLFSENPTIGKHLSLD